MLIPKTKDGRVVFALPFGQHVMLGTTDTDYTDIEQEPVLESGEVSFLLETLAPYVDQVPRADQVSAGFGGLRPLIAADPSKGTKSLVRDHEVEHDPKSNLLSLLGGKWTTYRLMAADAIDAACQLLQHPQPCSTDKHLLWGGKDYRFEDWQKLQTKTGLDADICQHLFKKYGTFAWKVADILTKNPDLGQRIAPGYPFILAEAVYAAREEMACTVRDFLARRLRLELEDWQAAISAAPLVAKTMGAELGWTAAEQAQQSDTYIQMATTWQQHIRQP
jgi:glycerol-3-phosphate dehydrogenase